MISGGGAGLMQHPDYLDGFYTYQDQKDAIKIWNQNVDEARKHDIPQLTMTDKENERTSFGLNALIILKLQFQTSFSERLI